MSRIADYITKTLADFYTGTAIQNVSKHTGRLPLSEEEENKPVPKAHLFADEPSMASERVAERVFYRHEDTPLNTLFFSQSNIDALQNQIRQAVQQMSGDKNYIIDRQNDEDLVTIMRSYYLQYADNSKANVGEQIAELNARVVNYCANNIMVEIEAYKYYRKDIMDFPPPIANPISSTIYGTRTGELRSFF